MKGQKTGGRHKGTPNKATVDREKGLDALRELVLQKLGPMTQAQITHATGAHHFLIRRPDGSLVRTTNTKQIDAALAGGSTMFQIVIDPPSTPAFIALLDRTFGKPAERMEVTGKDGRTLPVRFVYSVFPSGGTE